jgi:LysR family transcriptional regulator, positive regulator for ilvC
MDLEDLKTFEHLATSLHFGKSARARGMSPSALTRRIQALEAEVGQPLLVRDQRQVQLSSAGSVFRTYAREQLERWQQLQASLRAEAETPSGELNIACTVTACHTILPTLLSRFRQRYPGITLRLLTQDAAQSRTQLEAGELDLAVIPTEPVAPRKSTTASASLLATKVLAHTSLAFIAPRDRTLLDEAWTELSSPRTRANTRRGVEAFPLPLVAPIGGLERQRLNAWLERRHMRARIVAEVRGNEGIIAMVSLGCGIGLVPELVLTHSPLQSTIQVLRELAPPRGYDVSLCVRPKALERRVVAVFWNLTQELLPATEPSRIRAGISKAP